MRLLRRVDAVAINRGFRPGVVCKRFRGILCLASGARIVMSVSSSEFSELDAPGLDAAGVVDAIAPVEDAPEFVESAAARHLRFMMVQDQMYAAAAKVNLLAGMGLDRTSGYAEAMATYEAKLADFNELRAKLGV